MPHAQNRRARLVLVIAVLAYVALSATRTAWRTRYRDSIKKDELCRNGAGVAIASDGLCYYAWLRSALIDGDWRFENELLDFNPWNREFCVHARPTPTGHFPNYHSVGPACAWAVPVVVCHALVSAGAFGTWPADGYSLPYQFTIAGTTLVLGVGTLLLLYQIARHFAEPLPAARTAALMGLGTTLVYYATVEPSMGHGPAPAAFALFCWYWLRGSGRRRRAAGSCSGCYSASRR